MSILKSPRLFNNSDNANMSIFISNNLICNSVSKMVVHRGVISPPINSDLKSSFPHAISQYEFIKSSVYTEKAKTL